MKVLSGSRGIVILAAAGVVFTPHFVSHVVLYRPVALVHRRVAWLWSVPDEFLVWFPSHDLSKNSRLYGESTLLAGRG